MKEDLSEACCYAEAHRPSHGVGASALFCKPESEPAARSAPVSRQGSSQVPVSIREVGRRIGISHSTVSLVLRNDPRISGPTRTKVMEALAEMDYRPDPTFHALARASRSRSVACVAVIEPADVAGLPTECAQGIRTAAGQFGYDVETFAAGRGDNQADLHGELARRGVRAIILSSSLESCAWRDFPWDFYAVVKIGNPVPGPRFHTVGEDEWLAAVDAFKAIGSRGFQRIGMVSVLPAAGRYDSQFLNGFLQATYHAPADRRVEVFSPSGKTDGVRSTELEAWIDAARPDVIFTDFITDAGWIRRVAAPRGLGVAFGSADGVSRSGMMPERRLIGENAFDLLKSLVHDCCYGEPGISCRTLIPGRWVEGGSFPLPTDRPR